MTSASPPSQATVDEWLRGMRAAENGAPCPLYESDGFCTGHRLASEAIERRRRAAEDAANEARVLSLSDQRRPRLRDYLAAAVNRSPHVIA